MVKIKELCSEREEYLYPEVSEKSDYQSIKLLNLYAFYKLMSVLNTNLNENNLM